MKHYSALIVVCIFMSVSGAISAQGGKLKYPAPKNEEPKPKPAATHTPRTPKERTHSGTKDLPSFEFYIGLAAIKPNSIYADAMTQSEYMSNPYFAAPLYSGKMEGGTGLGLDYAFYNPLNAINRKMYTNHFEWGLNWGFEGGFIPHHIENCADHFDSGTIGEEIVSTFKGRYWFYGAKIGPTLTLKPFRDNNMRIDFGFRFKPFFNSLTDLSGSSTDVNGYNIYVDVARQEGEGSFDFCTELEFAVRWPMVRMFVSTTKGFEDVNKYDEEVTYNGSTSTQSFTAAVNLNYVRFGLDINISGN